MNIEHRTLNIKNTEHRTFNVEHRIMYSTIYNKDKAELCFHGFISPSRRLEAVKKNQVNLYPVKYHFEVSRRRI